MCIALIILIHKRNASKSNMPKIKHQQTKTLHIRPNGRSADFIAPNFIYGCAGGCRNSYCYVMRYNYDTVYINDNIEQIINVIATHADKLAFPKPPNQTDLKFWTYDIGCSTDVVLHWKHYPWIEVFDFFKNNSKIKATFATKYVNNNLLKYAAEQKIRIRYSIMPQAISDILEPNTTKISDRINAILPFIQAGYDVHINFSPIVVYENWLENYRMLFSEIAQKVPEELRTIVKAECIFLTHNSWQHERNLTEGRAISEQLLWQPKLQETKLGRYKSEAVRYHHPIKRQFINQWQKLHEEIIPWNTIRYIF